MYRRGPLNDVLQKLYGISARSFSTITDEELDSVVMEIRTFHPNCGSKSLAGHLVSRNVKVPKCIDIVGKLLRFVDESSEEGKMAIMLVVTRLLYGQTCYHLTSIEEFKFPNNFNNTSVRGNAPINLKPAGGGGGGGAGHGVGI